MRGAGRAARSGRLMRYSQGMNEVLGITNEQINDLPLLLASVDELGIGRVIDM